MPLVQALIRTWSSLAYRLPQSLPAAYCLLLMCYSSMALLYLALPKGPFFHHPCSACPTPVITTAYVECWPALPHVAQVWCAPLLRRFCWRRRLARAAGARGPPPSAQTCAQG